MQTIIDKNKSVHSVNDNKHFSVELSSNGRVLPDNDVSIAIDAYNRYFTEKDTSNIHRLIFTIHPYCTNVLFNNVTEIVNGEGGDNPSYILGEDRLNAIRNTILSHPDLGNYVYHCGYDIFNNHWLRRMDFSVINKELNSIYSDTFNTINDLQRDKDGNIVKSVLTSKHDINNITISGLTEQYPLHLYSKNTIKSFNRAKFQGVVEDNGWFGFINKASIDTPNYFKDNETSYSINRCMLNNKPCEQIDFYPDRSLYSFIPKENKFKWTMEDNWKVALMYPSDSYDDCDLIQDGLKCSIDLYDGISLETTKTLMFKTYIRNTFAKDDIVNLIFTWNDETGNTITKKIENIKIRSVGYQGYNEAFFFNIDSSRVVEYLNNNITDIRVIKVRNGVECKYYFRRLKKLYKTINGQQFNYNTTLNKLAFGRTIYNDYLSQVIINDNVDLSSIRDNLGRPISDIYFVIVKNNNSEEFSHCFGPISSGLDLMVDVDNYNIHKIHNISIGNGDYDNYINESPKHLENNITINNDGMLLDIVEFYPELLSERTLEDVYHRFNTVQRENTNDDINGESYNQFTYDEINIDDYCVPQGNEEDSGFTITKLSPKWVNLNPEGYYYNPFYRIPIKEFEDDVNEGFHIKIKNINIPESAISDNTIEIEIESGDSYYLETKYNDFYEKDFGIINPNSKLIFYKSDNPSKKYYGNIIKISGNTYTVEFDNDAIPSDNYILFKKNLAQNSYALDLDSFDGKYVWRNVKSFKNLSTNSELYDSVFMNNAHYHYLNIDFYLRRQDPIGDYDLSLINNPIVPQFIKNLIITGKRKDVSSEEYVTSDKIKC